MHWKRSACGLLLGGGLSILSMGCAAVDALVSSPAGNSAQKASPERMAAIGRVFENQGNYVRASAMYRKALSTDPRNSIATERLEYIASMKSKRSFDTSHGQQSSLIAVADSLNANHVSRTSSPRPSAAQRAEKVTEAIAAERSTLMASLQPAAVGPEPTPAMVSETDTDIVLPVVETADVEIAMADGGEIELTNPGWQLDTDAVIETDDAADVAMTFAPAAKVSDVTTVGFEGSDEQTATVAAMESSWKRSKKIITLNELLEWSDAPAENQENLLYALRSGEDDGVKAYAASLLADCSRDDSQIDAALLEACDGGSDLIRVSAWDVLMQRGHVAEQGVNDLLSLTKSDDAGIRAQAAASLRHCFGTEWSSASVSGLTELLVDSDDSVVAVAAATLGDFGADAGNCRAMLMNLLSQSQDELVLSAADLALNRIPVQDVTLQPVETILAPVTEQSAASSDEYLPAVE